MNAKDELEFFRLWIKHGIGEALIQQGKINGQLKDKGFPCYVAYDVDGNVYIHRVAHQGKGGGVMSKKKMCARYYGSSVEERELCRDVQCPPNANRKCEIVTKKPKYKTIKGRVFFAKEKHGPLCIDTCNIAITDALEAAFKKYGPFRISLVVEAKYLKGGK